VTGDYVLEGCELDGAFSLQNFVARGVVRVKFETSQAHCTG
jgi:hypothetical protein